jgi:sterol desaturase/sphingolipid hydroxylase (fatty acid hydroxylase superfamily)
MGALYALVSSGVRGGVLIAFAALHEYAPFDIGTDDGPAAWLGAYLAVDFAFYWFHRTIHEVRIGWAAHVNHHSSRHYNYATAFRQSLFEPLIEPFFMAPLVLVGFEPLLVVTCLALNFVYQFWPHTELFAGGGPLGAVFVTPSHHRVHHAANVQYLDKNYGGTLIVWDRLFGTFEPELEPCRFGITRDIATHNPIKATFHEWSALVHDLMSSHDMGQVFGYALRPPGWSPTDASQTSRARQKRHRNGA